MTDPFSSRLDPEALKTFMEVARLSSFSAAAERLNKTPAAISYRIKVLEEGMGCPLFERTTRTVSLTPAGHILLERATQIMEWMYGLPDELKQANEGIESSFTLVVNNLLYDPVAIGGLLATLSSRFPRTAFCIRRSVFMGVWEEMLYGGGHMAIGAPGWHAISDALETRVLGQVEWSMVMHPGHPLVLLPQPLGDDVLRQYPAVNVEDTSERLNKRIAWRLSGQHEIKVPSMQTKVACHLNGVGIGFLPRNMAEHYVRMRKLVVRSVRNGRSPSPMSLAWRRGDAGRISLYLQHLFEERDPLILPFLHNINPELPTSGGGAL